jgi:hypothetical protein
VIGKKSNPRGVALRPFNYQTFSIRRNAMLRVTCAQADLFYRLMWAENGKPFDHKAISLLTFFGAPRNWTQPESWFCAELVTYLLISISLFSYKLLINRYQVSAQDLLLLLNAHIDVARFNQPIPLDWKGPA